MPGTRTKIVRIGNSQGIRIPRSLLEQAGLLGGGQDTAVGREVELEVGPEGILMRQTRQTRAGWEMQFRLMAERGEDALLDDTPQTSDWDESEWEWDYG